MTGTTTPLNSMEMISARIERLPFSRWHVMARVLVGAVTFFDGFDQLMIAYSLPEMIGKWSLTPSMISWVIAVGGLGMLFGALCGGWLADRFGRLPVIAGCLVIYAALSFVMGFTDNLALFMLFRFIQGGALAAEVPIAASYIGEITKAHNRGKFVLIYEAIFPVGLLCSALVSSWVVPHWGYRWLFVLGAVPIVLLPALLRLPESPRWLASRGRLDEADAAVTRIEDLIVNKYGKTLPEPEPSLVHTQSEPQGTFREVFQGPYLRRTLMLSAAWFSAFFVNYGMSSWLPSLLKTLFELDTQTSLRYSVFTMMAGLIGCIVVALVIDKLGRRISIAGALFCAGMVIFTLVSIGVDTPNKVVMCAAGSALFVFAVNSSIVLYTAELYPSRIRAIGCSVCGASGRIGVILGPLAVGQILERSGNALTVVFLVLGSVAVLGAIVVAVFAVETTNRTLEEISPA